MKALIILFIFTICWSALAQRRDADDLAFAAFMQDPRESLRAARDIIREGEQRADSAMQRTEVEHGICVDCEPVLAITGHVEDILVSLGEAPREVEDLIVVSQYMHYINDQGQPDCHEITDLSLNPEFANIEPEDAILIHSGEIDLDRVLSWRINGGILSNGARAGDSYFLRGRGDDKDIFIRLDFPEGIHGNPSVSVYRLIDFDENIEETALRERERRINLPNVESPDSNPLAGFPRNESLDGGTSLINSATTSLHVGPVVRFKNYLLRDISVLDFSSTQSIDEDTNLEISGEVTLKRRRARFSLVGTHGEGEQAWLQVDDRNDVRVGMPYQFSYDGAPVTGTVMASTNGYGGSLSYRNGSDSRTEASVFRDGNKTNYNLDHRRRINKKSTITFRVSNEDGQNVSWLLYRYDLD